MAFFSFSTSFYETQNAWQIQKKCVFWHCALHYSTKKVFFNICFTFLTKKFSIFNFLLHYNKFHFFCFLCSSYGKHLKNVKKVDFFSMHLEKKWKKYRFCHGSHLLLSRQKWKKTLKKTCFFHVFLHCFFAFCLDLRWTRTFWTGFSLLKNAFLSKHPLVKKKS